MPKGSRDHQNLEPGDDAYVGESEPITEASEVVAWLREIRESLTEDEWRALTSTVASQPETIAGELVPVDDVAPVPAQRLTGRIAQARVDYDPDDVVPLDVDEALLEAVSPNTRRNYEYQWGRFVKWCSANGREYLPATSGTVRAFIWAHWSWSYPDGRLRGRRNRPYAPATVELALAVVCAVHKWKGYPSPWADPRVGKQLAAYGLRWAKQGYRPDVAYAISLDDSLAMARTCDMQTCAGLRDATMFRLHFEMGARASEIVNLNISDMRFVTADRLLVHIAYSKTDRRGEGREVPVEADHEVAPELCAVALVRRWLDLLKERGHTSGPLFRGVRGSGQRRRDGSHTGTITEDRQTKAAYEIAHLRAVGASGIDVDPVTGEHRHVVPHSNRAGFITAASEAGVDTAMIAPHTGHSPNSPVIFRYVRSGRRWGQHNPGARIRQARRRGV